MISSTKKKKKKLNKEYDVNGYTFGIIGRRP